MSIASLINKFGNTLDVERPTSSRDKLGGITNTFTVLKNDIVGWKQDISSQLQQIYGQQQLEVKHSVYFNIDPGVQAGDRLKIGSDYYEVVGVKNEAGINRIWRVDVLAKANK